MLRTTLHLVCDQCSIPWPRLGDVPAPVDGAIFSAPQLRIEARKLGWVRERRSVDSVDVCPSCWTKTKKAGVQ